MMFIVHTERYDGPSARFMAGRMGLPEGDAVTMIWPELAAAWKAAGNPRPLMMRHRIGVIESIGDSIRDSGSTTAVQLVEVFVP